MKKELEFKLKLDNSEFNKAISDIQKKIKDATSPIAMMQQVTSQRLGQAGFGGIMSPQSSEAYQRATQASRREMDQLIAEQAKGQEKLGKIIAKRSELLKKLQDQQKDLVKGSEEELKVKEKIARVEANNQQLRETYKQRDSALNQALDAKEKMSSRGFDRIKEAYQQGGMGGAARAGIGMIGARGALGGLGFLAALAEKGSDIYRDMSKSGIRTETSMGSAIQGSLGRDVSNIYGRRTAFEQMFAPERARAAQQALEARQATETADKVGLGSGLLKNVSIGAGGGMLFGGPMGALIGGAGGLVKGLWDIGSDERRRSLALSPFSKTASKRYESMVAEEMLRDYESSYDAQKRQNPFKTAAVSEYEQNFQRNLMAQRMMGMGNKQFYGQGGFLSQGIGAGFTQDMILDMASGISGSGGSTQMMRNAVLGNKMSRGLDLTNAGQILGTLSGGLGTAEKTEQATIKLLAEGMKLGLDDSKFAEENRRFTQLTAEIVAKSAAQGEDVSRVSGGFGRFVGENTNLGIGAAKTAYEQYQQISQETAGPRGVMRAAGFLSDPNLSKISTITKQGLMQVPESELNEDNPLVQAAAQEAGVSPKQIISSVSGVNQGAVSRFRDADDLRNKLRAYTKSIGKERLSAEDIASAPKNIQAQFNKLVAFQTAELGYQGQREAVSRGLGTINVPGVTDTGREAAARAKMEGGGPGRMEDTTIKAMAADSKVVLDNFNEMAPAMAKAAESTAAWTKEVREMNAALQQALESARSNKDASTLKNLEDVLKKYSAGVGTQPQAGKQSK